MTAVYEPPAGAPGRGRQIGPSLGSVEQLRAGRLPSRIVQLLVGLVLYGFTMALMVRADLGLDPWDVFHQGAAQHLPLTFGQVVIVTGALVLLLWIPLRQVPGLGTVLNVIIIGLAADAGLALIERPDELWARIVLMVASVVGNGLASALYIGAHLGPGPRDGLWLGLLRRTRHSVRVLRTTLELTVLTVGFLLGGTVGAGTVLYAVLIGPATQFFLPFTQATLRPKPPVDRAAG